MSEDNCCGCDILLTDENFTEDGLCIPCWNERIGPWMGVGDESVTWEEHQAHNKRLREAWEASHEIPG